jgi:hypothetical protein
MSRRRPIRPIPPLAPLLGALLAALVTAAGCAPSPAQVEVDQDAVRELLEAYLPALSQAYATGDVSPLRGLAAEKEVLATEKRIVDIAREGRVVHPTFRDLTIEKLDVYQHSNAYVTTVERWDLQVYAAGTDRLLSEEMDQVNRVRYQLKRNDDGSWRVLFRELVRTDGGGAG